MLVVWRCSTDGILTNHYTTEAASKVAEGAAETVGVIRLPPTTILIYGSDKAKPFGQSRAVAGRKRHVIAHQLSPAAF